MKSYIKVIAAPGKGHNWTVEYYSESGELLGTESISRQVLSRKLNGGRPFSIKKGEVWGIIVNDSSIMRVGTPKFLRSS